MKKWRIPKINRISVIINQLSISNKKASRIWAIGLLFDEYITYKVIKLIVNPQILANLISITKANGEMPIAAITDFGLKLSLLLLGGWLSVFSIILYLNTKSVRAFPRS